MTLATLIDAPAFDWSFFPGSFRPANFCVRLPDEGVTVTPYPHGSRARRDLTDWRYHLRAKGDAAYRFYVRNVVEMGLSWSERVRVPHACVPQGELCLMAGVVQLEDRLIQATAKRLFGSVPEKFSEAELRTIGFALWNPWWAYAPSQNWAQKLSTENRLHRIKADNEKKIAGLLEDFDN